MKKGKTVHFASFMDICHLKNSELEPQVEKYKGRVVLRGDTVKDDSGSYAVFTEQGSPVSQMTAAKVMDVFSRLPGCAGQAADAVSAHTTGQNGRCSIDMQNSKVRMSRFLDTSTKTQMAQIICPVWRIQSFLLSENLYGLPLAGVLWERQFEKVLLKHGWGKVPNWECSFVNREKGLLFFCVFGRYKTGWKDTEHRPDVENIHERR